MRRHSEVAWGLCGMGLGACLMYWFDPRQGRRRRALLRDQLLAAGARLDRESRKTWRNARNRAYGMFREAGHLFQEDHATDEVLRERIRACLGRVVSHASDIQVAVRDGCATLSGPVAAEEVDDLLAAVAGVRSVRNVESQLEVAGAS